jgi:hypothetical protein
VSDTRKDYGPTGCVNRSFMLLAMVGMLAALIRKAAK